LDILSSSERRRVEQFLLSSPEQKEKLVSMANLIDYIKQTPEYNSAAAAAGVRNLDDDRFAETPIKLPMPSSSDERTSSWLSGLWMRLATGVVVIAVIGLGIYLVRQKTSPASLQLSKEQLERIEKINRQYTEPGDDTLQVKLEPLVRSGQNSSNRIMLLPGKKVVELNIGLLSNNYKSYQAAFKKFDGAELATIKNLSGTTESQKSELKIKLPVDVLKVGVYGLDISGETNDDQLESIREFVFEVVE